MGGLGSLEREGAEEGLEHLLHWQGCETMFVSVSWRRCACVRAGSGRVLL